MLHYKIKSDVTYTFSTSPWVSELYHIGQEKQPAFECNFLHV